MLRKIHLWCPNLKRKVTIHISIPKKNDDGSFFDCLYLLDGQNVFKDSDSAFGSSMHLGKYLSLMSSRFNKKICAIGIDNAGSDLGRINEYTPFKLENYASSEWIKQDLNVSKMFEKDLINTIIPYIQNNFPVKKDAEHNFILGSSLGALEACYLANHNPDLFSVAGLFSICPFLCEKSFDNFMKNNLNHNLKNFIYVGLDESSDGEYDKTLYFNAAKDLHEYLISQGVKSRLVIDPDGYHHEQIWEKHLLQFLSYIYFDDIEISD